MSVNISNWSAGTVGRMFARQNIDSLYSSRKSLEAAEPDTAGQTVDTVSLSSLAPKPLTTGFLQAAMAAGKSIGSGGSGETESGLTEETGTRLREDRVFAALSALTLLGYDETRSGMARWPGGIPSPTTEEMEMARRRLSQRPFESEETADVAAVQNDRLELLQRIGKADLSVITGTEAQV